MESDMDVRSIISRIDYTLLKPTATLVEVEQLCNEAMLYKTACVCVPPCYVQRIKQTFSSKLNICTVVGFPFGYSPTGIKVEETLLAVSDGADEIDMVINICDLKNGDLYKVASDIKAVRASCYGKVLKVIVETCYLSEEEKIKLCETVTTSGADYIKTSTGFGPTGAALADVRLFREHIGPGVKIKAAGGIKTLSEIEAYINNGCDRVGSSGAIAMLKELGAIPS